MRIGRDADVFQTYFGPSGSSGMKHGLNIHRILLKRCYSAGYYCFYRPGKRAVNKRAYFMVTNARSFEDMSCNPGYYDGQHVPFVV